MDAPPDRCTLTPPPPLQTPEPPSTRAAWARAVTHTRREVPRLEALLREVIEYEDQVLATLTEGPAMSPSMACVSEAPTTPPPATVRRRRAPVRPEPSLLEFVASTLRRRVG